MNVEKLAHRPMQYLAESGLTWLTSGLAFLFLGASSLLGPIVARQYPDTVYGLIVQAAGTVCALLVFWGGFQLKRRIVYPRGGHVVLRVSSPAVRFVRPMVFGGVMLICVLFRGGHRTLDFSRMSASPFLALVFPAVVSAFVGWKEKSGVAYLFTAYLVCLGGAIWRVQPSALAGMSWLEMGIGTPLAAYGAIRLYLFVKANPQVEAL